jgi:hypothetical protein
MTFVQLHQEISCIQLKAKVFKYTKNKEVNLKYKCYKQWQGVNMEKTKVIIIKEMVHRWVNENKGTPRGLPQWVLVLANYYYYYFITSKICYYCYYSVLDHTRYDYLKN